MIRAQKVGDWEKVMAFVDEMPAAFQKASQEFLMMWGLKAEGIAKMHISRQDLNWVPLSPKTISAKVRKGYSENILVRSSSYFQSITSWVDGNTVYAGVKRTAKNKDGQEIANIAEVHEYGSQTAGIPARPLWQPTLKETNSYFLRGKLLEKIIAKSLSAALGKASANAALKPAAPDTGGGTEGFVAPGAKRRAGGRSRLAGDIR